jgi:hypothetical protein
MMVQTDGIKDSDIIAKLAVVNQGLLQVIADECGKRFSGLGKADTTIRRVVGSTWARRAASLHSAHAEVRHIHELDPATVVGQFRTDIKRAIRAKQSTSEHTADAASSEASYVCTSVDFENSGSAGSKAIAVQYYRLDDDEMHDASCQCSLVVAPEASFVNASSSIGVCTSDTGSAETGSLHHEGDVQARNVLLAAEAPRADIAIEEKPLVAEDEQPPPKTLKRRQRQKKQRQRPSLVVGRSEIPSEISTVRSGVASKGKVRRDIDIESDFDEDGTGGMGNGGSHSGFDLPALADSESISTSPLATPTHVPTAVPRRMPWADSDPLEEPSAQYLWQDEAEHKRGSEDLSEKEHPYNAAGAKGDGGSLSGSDLPAQASSYLVQQLLINNIKALHNCKEVLAELLPEVVLSSALTGFESMSKFDVIGAEGQSLFAHKARALRELAHVSPQLMCCTAAEARTLLGCERLG